MQVELEGMADECGKRKILTCGAAPREPLSVEVSLTAEGSLRLKGLPHSAQRAHTDSSVVKLEKTILNTFFPLKQEPIKKKHE